ncbi:putative chaperone CsaA [subsurface metagenome]
MLKLEEFLKTEMRVGTVIRAENFPEARKAAYRLWIDFGEYGQKKSSAQITGRYKPEDLINRQVIAVTNFPPKRIAGFFSDVLVLGAVPAEGDVILLKPDCQVKPGTRVL